MLVPTDHEIVILAVNHNAKAVQFASAALKLDPEVLRVVTLGKIQVGFSLIFCVFQSENAENAPFFVHFNKK